MGQRHQIYVRFPIKDKNNIAGYHHQWLYGYSAISALSRVVQFWVNSEDKTIPKDSSFRLSGPLRTDVCYGLPRQSKVIDSLYSIDIEEGYWANICNFIQDYTDLKPGEIPSEVLDPRNGDNNDGITIIDCFDPEVIKYCFMSVGHLEGEINPKKTLVPMSAREYLLCYYPEFMDKKGGWKDHNDKTKGRQVFDPKDFDTYLSRLLLIEEKATLLTLAECKKLFPKMYKRVKSTKKST